MRTKPSSSMSILTSNSSSRPRIVSPPLPMSRPIWSGVDLDRQHLRGVLGELGARLGERLGHLAEDEQPGVLGLRQRAAQDVAASTPVILMSICRAVMPSAVPATLKSMSPRWSSAPWMSVRTIVVVALLDQAHRDARDRRLDRHAGVHQREASSRRPRPSTSEPFDSRISETSAHRVRELLGVRDDRHQGALGERAMADVAALRAAHEAGLADGEGREVVVVDVALRRVERQVVDALLLLGRAQRDAASAPASGRG